MTAHYPSLATITALQQTLDDLIVDLHETAFYRTLTSPHADPHLVSDTLKHVYLAITQYQPHLISATFTAVGRMRKESESLIKTMILQQLEEVEQVEMARRNYLRLGGERASADGQMFPECTAVAAMCHFLGEHCHPASYLGLMYVIDALSPIMRTQIQRITHVNGRPAAAQEFFAPLAAQYLHHADKIASLIQEVIRLDPTAGKSILYGLRSFLSVYPLPIWNAAYQRARLEELQR